MKIKCIKDSRNNRIFGDLGRQKNHKINFKGSDNIIFFAGGSENVSVNFNSNNALVFIGDNVRLNGWGIQIFPQSSPIMIFCPSLTQKILSPKSVLFPI